MDHQEASSTPCWRTLTVRQNGHNICKMCFVCVCVCNKENVNINHMIHWFINTHYIMRKISGKRWAAQIFKILVQIKKNNWVWSLNCWNQPDCMICTEMNPDWNQIWSGETTTMTMKQWISPPVAAEGDVTWSINHLCHLSVSRDKDDSLN